MIDIIDSNLTKKTRKDHTCWMCNKIINKGTNDVQSTVLVYDGEISRIYSHPACEKIFNSKCKYCKGCEDIDGCYDFGFLNYCEKEG